MEVVRILNLRHFDRTARRFRDIVCKNASKSDPTAVTPDGRGGFSVFDPACACVDQGQNPNCVCSHISKFYDQVAGEPCAYWRFDHEMFNPPIQNPKNIPVLVHVPSHTGDDCHANLHNVSDDRLKNARKHQTEQTLRICVGGVSEPFTADRAIELINIHYPDPT